MEDKLLSGAPASSDFWKEMYKVNFQAITDALKGNLPQHKPRMLTTKEMAKDLQCSKECLIRKIRNHKEELSNMMVLGGGKRQHIRLSVDDFFKLKQLLEDEKK